MFLPFGFYLLFLFSFVVYGFSDLVDWWLFFVLFLKSGKPCAMNRAMLCAIHPHFAQCAISYISYWIPNTFSDGFASWATGSFFGLVFAAPESDTSGRPGNAHKLT